MTFWEHLEQLRKVIFRALFIVLAIMVVLLGFKTFLFDSVVLAPLSGDFFLYRWIDVALGLLGMTSLSEFSLSLINVDLSAQFFTHLKITFYMALIISVPYIIYLVWGFVSPALYQNEKRWVRGSFVLASVLFYLGVLVGYSFVFPLTLRFLATYQVSETVPNTISLLSYISSFLSLILIMGLAFEIPAVAALLSRVGILTKQILKKYRKYAVVAAMVLSAVITPSGDAFTMLMVALPLYFLYELSIILSKNSITNNDIDK